MNTIFRKFIKLLIILHMFLISTFLICDQSMAIGRRIASPSGNTYYKTNDTKGHVERILSVLESRIADHQLVEKAKDKLFRLSEDEIRLIASLCDRINNEGNTTGSDIAFSLVTALIILS